MAGLQDHGTPRTKSTIVAAVLQVALVAMQHYTAAGRSGMRLTKMQQPEQ